MRPGERRGGAIPDILLPLASVAVRIVAAVPLLVLAGIVAVG